MRQMSPGYGFQVHRTAQGTPCAASERRAPVRFEWHGIRLGLHSSTLPTQVTTQLMVRIRRKDASKFEPDVSLEFNPLSAKVSRITGIQQRLRGFRVAIATRIHSVTGKIGIRQLHRTLTQLAHFLFRVVQAFLSFFQSLSELLASRCAEA